ncbi:MAG: hypothetical protein ACTSUE_05435 [Promethearchaeota archaeon]
MTETSFLKERKIYSFFRKISIFLFKITSAFMILFSFIYFIVITTIAVLKGLILPWAAFFDMLLGAGIIGLFVFFYGIAHTRFGSLFMTLNLAFWWAVPCNWIINEWDKMQYDFAPTFFIIWSVLIYLGLIALLGFVNFWVETVHLIINKRSPLLGPWFAGTKHLFKTRLGRKKLKAIRRTMVALAIVMGMVIPAILTMFDAYAPRIEITPKNYDITYNFWATPNINGTYESWVQGYGIGPDYYSQEALDQFNKHSVNLDLTFNSITNASVATLVQWETRCPNITYRITIWPSGGLSSITGLVENATEILMTCESNGTLDQWIGFCFDIEGDPFTYQSSYDSYQEATKMWNDLFDYIDLKSTQRGATIEMECVSDSWTAMDAPFDGDADLQVERGFNSYIPERFTTYAPMIYRCWYDGEIPFGSAMDPSDPWSTSFEVYSQLYTLQAGIPDEKTGFYIGITNTSCYGRDLPQPEPYTWPDGPNTGYTNLLRDVLIAKHFGIKEITFFLAWTWIENNYSMGGVFESYGNDFLDVVNETVNANPPESFDIFYRQSDAVTGANFRTDWLYDMSKFRGIIEFGLLWAGSIFMVTGLPTLMKKFKR